MVHRLLLTSVVTILAVPGAAQSRLDRVIGEQVTVHKPIQPCAVPAVAAWVTQVAQVPSGIEGVPEPCQMDRSVRRDALEPVPLIGMTVREALDTLVKLDSRYSWTESDGVVVMRPIEAATDRNHFLHRIAPSFALTDVNMDGAMKALQAALGQLDFRVPQFPGRTADGDRSFSLALGATSVIEALNAIVRTHGAMRWTISYCLPPAIVESAMIRLSTFDGSGVATGPVFLRGPDGKPYNPCGSRQ